MDPDPIGSQLYQGYDIRNVSKSYGQAFADICFQHGILCGERYGVQGISIYELLVTGDQSDTVYEIGVSEFAALPSRIKNKISKYRLIVHDYCEAGLSVGNMTGNTQLFNYIAQAPNLIFSSDNLDLSDYPVYKHLYQTVADTRELGVPTQNRAPSRSLLIPAWKPRVHRIDLLKKFDDLGLLSNSEWSLHCEYNALYSESTKDLNPKLTDKHSIINMEWVDEWFYSAHPFVTKYQSILPKSIYQPEGKYKSPNILHNDLHWDFSWYVCLETYFDIPFITEKTFKGFASGLPVILYGNKRMHDSLTQHGFRCLTAYGDTPEEQHSSILSQIQTTFNPADVMHNYNLVNNDEKMLTITITSLLGMIESIVQPGN